jgi:hypothetical protein
VLFELALPEQCASGRCGSLERSSRAEITGRRDTVSKLKIRDLFNPRSNCVVYFGGIYLYPLTWIGPFEQSGVKMPIFRSRSSSIIGRNGMSLSRSARWTVNGLFALGCAVAFPLSSLKKLEGYRLLNILGMVYGLLGVIVLSELIANVEWLRRLIVDRVSVILIWAHFVMPLGSAAVAFLLGAFYPQRYPAGIIFGSACLGFFLVAMPVAFVFEDLVSAPKFERLRDPVVRSRMCGTLLIIIGIVAQIIAAVQKLLRS